MDGDRWGRLVAGIGGGALLLLGVWAMASPTSFFEQLATFEPYNQHFLQDIGAFQIGLGAVLLLSLIRGDALTVALVGVGIGMAAHTISHLLGTDLGGSPTTDIPTFAVLTLVMLGVGGRRFGLTRSG